LYTFVWDLILVSVYTKGDPDHETSFIPLPRLDGEDFAFFSSLEVPTYQQLSLLWRKLRQCCVKLDESSCLFPSEEEARQKELMDEIIAACNMSL